MKQSAPERVAFDPTSEPDFKQRVAAYVAAARVADGNAAQAMAVTIVCAELHERELVAKMHRDGLTGDEHRVLNGVGSKLMRLRKAIGVLEPKKPEATGFLDG